jgi:hypothetical protein
MAPPLRSRELSDGIWIAASTTVSPRQRTAHRAMGNRVGAKPVHPRGPLATCGLVLDDAAHTVKEEPFLVTPRSDTGLPHAIAANTGDE